MYIYIYIDICIYIYTHVYVYTYRRTSTHTDLSSPTCCPGLQAAPAPCGNPKRRWMNCRAAAWSSAANLSTVPWSGVVGWFIDQWPLGVVFVVAIWDLGFDDDDDDE